MRLSPLFSSTTLPSRSMVRVWASVRTMFPANLQYVRKSGSTLLQFARSRSPSPPPISSPIHAHSSGRPFRGQDDPHRRQGLKSERSSPGRNFARFLLRVCRMAHRQACKAFHFLRPPTGALRRHTDHDRFFLSPCRKNLRESAHKTVLRWLQPIPRRHAEPPHTQLQLHNDASISSNLTIHP